MLKIKDNVDLKELEKFGFRKELHVYQIDLQEEWVTYMSNIISSVYIKIPDRIIRISNHFKPVEIIKIDVIYDLIQAGLVEKVER